MSKNFFRIDKGLSLSGQTSDPVTDVKAGDVYFNTALQAFRGYANGAWGSLAGSSSGEINVLTTGSNDSTGWTAGTSHSVATDTSNSPLNPVITTSISMSSSAAVTLGSQTSTSGDYKAITLPTGLENKKLKVEIYFTSPSSSDGTWALAVYKGSTKLALSTDSSGDTILPSGVTGKFTAYFDTDSTNSYSINFVQRTRTNANTLYVTSVIVGPGIQPQGAVVGDWTLTTASITSSGGGAVSTGTGGSPASAMSYRRVGDAMECILTWRFGTSSPSFGTGTTYRITIPGGYSSNYASVINASVSTHIGTGKLLDNSVSTFYDVGVSLGSSVANTTYVILAPLDGTNVDIGPTSPFTFAADDQITVHFTVPIAEWAGSGTVNLAQNDVEYAYNTSTSSSNDTTSFGYGPSGGSLISSGTAGGTNKRVRFQTPIQATDIITIEVDPGGTGRWVEIPAMDTSANILESLHQEGSEYFGLGIYNVSGMAATDVQLKFGFYPDSHTTDSSGYNWSTLSTWKYRVKKAAAGAAVGFGIADTNSSGLVPSGAYNKSTGAWILGNSGTDTTHTFHVGASTRSIKFGPGNTSPGFVLDNAASSAACALTQASGTTQLAFGVATFQIAANNYTNISNTTNLGTTGATVVASATSAGAWTLGVSATSLNHLMYGDSLTISRNQSGSGATLRATGDNGSGDGGSAVALQYNGTTKWSIFQRNQTNGIVATAHSLVFSTGDLDNSFAKMVLSPSGVLTVGASSGVTSSHTIQAQPTADYALKIINSNSTNAQSSGIRVSAGAGSSDTSLAVTNYNNSANFLVVKGNGVCDFGPSTGTTNASHTITNNENSQYALKVFQKTSGSAPYGIRVHYENTAPNDNNGFFYEARDSSAQRFAVINNGGVANFQANNVNLSDERLKTNIAPTSSKLGFICSLQVKDFEYKDAPGKVNTGLIAQEVEVLDPSLVQETGSIQTVDGVEIQPKAVRTTEIYHMMIKAIQELKAELDTAKARIAALEGN